MAGSVVPRPTSPATPSSPLTERKIGTIGGHAQEFWSGQPREETAGMSPVETEQQDGPSARTVSALVDDAAERLAAAGIDTPREDAEAIVADALGLKREELSDDAVVTDEAAADIEAKVKVRLERQPLA